ncbi:MAG: helix-turn-helix transcriptional regulator [Lachnospiraceae bacterium]|nr:helix-turn-helix transcriptional regulator [Lachnospiraceae bacterium]
MFDMKACGARIRELRKDNNMTQEKLAYELYISQDHLRKIESGKSGASIDLLIDMAGYFGVSLDYLIRGKRQMDDAAEELLMKRKRELYDIANDIYRLSRSL